MTDPFPQISSSTQDHPTETIAPSGTGRFSWLAALLGERAGTAQTLGHLSYRFILMMRQWATLEEGRAALFSPVWLGLGIGIYFSLPAEPPLAIGVVLCSLLALIVLGVRARLVITQHPSLPLIMLLVTGSFLIALGFTAAGLRTQSVATVMLDREVAFADVTGVLARIEDRVSDQRFVIKPDMIEGLSREELPSLIRVTWRGQAVRDILPGDHVQVRASLSPLPAPAMPGGYDYGRHLFFQKIGAVGFTVSPLTHTEDGGGINAASRPRSFFDQMRVRTEKIRLVLFQHIIEAAPGQGGAIVAAIVTGKREAINAGSERALRDSGLAHLLAISGLHMGLATGLIFFGMRFGLSCLPGVALYHPVKKWAALAALLSGAFYLLLSGGAVSAQRAFIMTAIMLLAILIDRRALSLRNVVIAACIILLLSPEALLQPGFQMSFGAVTALIAAYEWAQQRRIFDNDGARMTSIVARFKRYATGVAITDTIAAIATAPFALYHFHRTAIYSLPANLIAMPIMAFMVMPMIIIAFLLMPLGLDGVAWVLAARGIEMILACGNYVANLPGAITITPAQSVWWLISFAIAGCLLCLLKGPLRYSGLLVLPVATGLMALTPQADIFLAGSGQNVAFVHTHEEGRSLLVYNKRRDRFSAKIWMESLGMNPDTSRSLSLKDHMPCDALGCVIERDLEIPGQKLVVSVSNEPLSLVDDCEKSTLVIALYPVHRPTARKCKATLLDRRSVWNDGAHGIWIKKDGSFLIRSVNDRRSKRPWGT